VAKSTVSRALQNDPRVKADTRKRIVELARKHGYAVNANARKLRQQRSNTIALVLHLPPSVAPGAAAPFIFQLLADVANGLWVRGQDLLLCSPESDQPLTYQTMLASKGADGIIFLGQGAGDGWLRDLARTRAPFVVWGAADPGGDYCAVGSDNFKGGVLVGRRFATMDRTRILFVGNREHPEMSQRWAGLKSAVAERADASLSAMEVPDFSFETALAHVAARLSDPAQPRPDAIFAASDTMAMAAIVAAQDAGLDVPDDITVVGYNDMPTAAHFRPALTTVRQDTREAGALLVEKLFQILDGGRPSSALLPTELIVRAS
jgi:DNA-binding LacI/PurR family transcriptional regulator